MTVPASSFNDRFGVSFPGLGPFPNIASQDVALVPGFIQSSAASVHRKKFMVTLERFGVTYELEKTKTEDLSNKKRDTIKEDKSRDTVKNITIEKDPIATSSDTASLKKTKAKGKGL